jgi:CelD/BcsL family acetyltransferase involved in cellulose biosynthesis
VAYAWIWIGGIVPDQKTRENVVVRRLTSRGELEALQDPWNTLIEDIPGSPIFSSWDWINTWRASYHDDGVMWLLTVWNEQEELIGIAPLVLRGGGGLLQPRRLAFLFYNPPVHQDIITRPEHRNLVCNAVTDYLSSVKREWDVLDLRGLAQDSCLQTEMSSMRGYFQEREGLICPYIELPSDWETFEKKTMGHNQRKQVRSRTRYLERDYSGQIRFLRITEPEQIAPAVDNLIQFNREKWRERDGVSSFEDARYRSFFHDVSLLAHERGWLRLYQLCLGDEVISTRCCFFYRGTYVDFQTAFNANYSVYAPGVLLMAHILKDAIQEGAREFDFLPGNYPWKLSWSTGIRQESHIVFGHNWRSFSSLVGGMVFEKTIEAGRKLLPDTTRERMNLFITRFKHRKPLSQQHEPHEAK